MARKTGSKTGDKRGARSSKPEREAPGAGTTQGGRRVGAPQRGGGAARRAGGGTGPAQRDDTPSNEPRGSVRTTSARGEPLRNVEDDRPQERGGMARGGLAHPGGRRVREAEPPERAGKQRRKAELGRVDAEPAKESEAPGKGARKASTGSLSGPHRENPPRNPEMGR